MAKVPFLRVGAHYKSLCEEFKVPEGYNRDAFTIPAHYIGYTVNEVRNGKAFITYDNGVSNFFSLTCPFHMNSVLG